MRGDAGRLSDCPIDSFLSSACISLEIRLRTHSLNVFSQSRIIAAGGRVLLSRLGSADQLGGDDQRPIMLRLRSGLPARRHLRRLLISFRWWPEPIEVRLPDIKGPVIDLRQDRAGSPVGSSDRRWIWIRLRSGSTWMLRPCQNEAGTSSRSLGFVLLSRMQRSFPLFSASIRWLLARDENRFADELLRAGVMRHCQRQPTRSSSGGDGCSPVVRFLLLRAAMVSAPARRRCRRQAVARAGCSSARRVCSSL